MSLFHSTPQELKDNLDALPERHSKTQIQDLVASLQADITSGPNNLNFAEKVHHYSNRHKELFCSYPMLYRTVCKGTYRPYVLDVILDSRDAMERGDWTKEKALEETIKKAVDEVNSLRANEKNTSAFS